MMRSALDVKLKAKIKITYFLFLSCSIWTLTSLKLRKPAAIFSF